MLPVTSPQSFPFDEYYPADCFFDVPPLETGQLSGLLSLDLQALTLFDPVQAQFSNFGIWFERAIAVIPSNPAFSASAGRIVVMPTAGHSDLAVWFRRPCQRIRTWLTGARQIRVTALDIDQRVLAQDCQGSAVFVQPPDDASIKPFPQHQIAVDAANIACVRISSDAPFVMDGFSCE